MPTRTFYPGARLKVESVTRSRQTASLSPPTALEFLAWASSPAILIGHVGEGMDEEPRGTVSESNSNASSGKRALPISGRLSPESLAHALLSCMFTEITHAESFDD
jgi:hypothetical protein